nr:hypothetical protein [uncultured Brevundimonas sp.]
MTGITWLIGFWSAVANALSPPASPEALAETTSDRRMEGVRE